jgi:hypothetical protein
VRAQNFQGGVQAVRVTLQRDVLETRGIPNEHNAHYYMNYMGYGSVPTYLWSPAGPLPAALALRTREAMVQGQRFADTLDFGPNGNQFFLALRYAGAAGSTLVLRQLGAANDLPLPRCQAVEWRARLRGPSAARDVAHQRIKQFLTEMPVAGMRCPNSRYEFVPGRALNDIPIGTSFDCASRVVPVGVHREKDTSR